MTDLLHEIPAGTVTPRPKPIHWYIHEWTPEVSTIKWTAGRGGAYYRSPMLAIDAAYKLTPSEIAAFAKRVKDDMGERGILHANIFEYSYNSLTPVIDGKNLWDQQHFGGLATLEWLESKGCAWAGDFALRLASSYYQNKVGYFRTGYNVTPDYQPITVDKNGQEITPYGNYNAMMPNTNGRTRTAGWILLSLASACRLLKKWGYTGPWADRLVSLVNLHLDLVRRFWPLQATPDGPTGDHLNVPHVEVFMLGILGNGLRQLAQLGFKCSDLMQKCEALIRAAEVRPLVFLYDLPFDVATGQPAALTEKQEQHIANYDAGKPESEYGLLRAGCNGVNLWLPGAIPPGSRLYADLMADARKRKIDKDYAWAFANAFGVL